MNFVDSTKLALNSGGLPLGSQTEDPAGSSRSEAEARARLQKELKEKERQLEEARKDRRLRTNTTWRLLELGIAVPHNGILGLPFGFQ